MSRRVTLPGADELFRKTDTPVFGAAAAAATVASAVAAPAEVEQERLSPAPNALTVVAPERVVGSAVRTVRPAKPRRKAADRRPTGRENHEEKITVYLSAEELVDLEQAKIALRSEHGLALDRGRIVREAVAVVLADLEARGEDSILVRRLRGI